MLGGVEWSRGRERGSERGKEGVSMFAAHPEESHGSV